MSDYFGFDYYEPKDLIDLMAEGEGDFKIIKAINRQSKAGNDMMVLDMRVRDCNGKEGFCTEFLVQGADESSKKRLATKIKNIAKAINKPELYGPKAMLAPQDLLGCKGKCYIKVQAGGEYPDKNVIAKYLVSQDFVDAEREQLANEQIAQLDDELPPW